ncbi:hypothetical protein G6F56_007343 [Rhizopus delemar]|nr:hypothetical protein G6F56_007343 [Rhizopus delemar]
MIQKVPKEEQSILENLLSIRVRLSAVKQDRSTYLKLEDITPLRLETQDQMKALSILRGGSLFDESRSLNRTDDVLDEILQIMSLCFLSLGKIKESPSVYSQVVTIKNIFDRLNEVGVYGQEFLQPYKAKLNEIEKILNKDREYKVVPEHVMEVLQYKFTQCTKIYEKLMDTLKQVDIELIPVLDRMIRIRQELGTVCCKRDYTPEDVMSLQNEIEEIDSSRVNGNFIGSNGSVLQGQEILTDLVEKLKLWSQDILLSCNEEFSPTVESMHERLLGIKRQLERLQLTHKWTLRQTDLFSYQHQLHDMVKLRYSCVEDQEKDPRLPKVVPKGQIVLDFLLHKCYRMIFVLLNESVPVSESLTPVYNHLTSVRKCLLAVKNIGAPCSAEELYPYQMKLSSIENMRKDGKFYDDCGNIPEGQGLCVDILDECYKILDSLGNESENNPNPFRPSSPSS